MSSCPWCLEGGSLTLILVAHTTIPEHVFPDQPSLLKPHQFYMGLLEFVCQLEGGNTRQGAIVELYRKPLS